MEYSEEFLRELAKDKVVGDFPPFDTGSIAEVEKYVKAIVGRIKDNYKLLIEPDFSYYGSGFASYIPVKVSKKDGSNIRATQEKNRVTYWTNGILIYISNLSPYWYYGASQWAVSIEDDKQVGGMSGFLRPESINKVDYELWRHEIESIKTVFDQYGYCLLEQGVLARQVNLPITVITVLAEKPYEVFDFFFHWSD